MQAWSFIGEGNNVKEITQKKQTKQNNQTKNLSTYSPDFRWLLRRFHLIRLSSKAELELFLICNGESLVCLTILRAVEVYQMHKNIYEAQ